MGELWILPAQFFDRDTNPLERHAEALRVVRDRIAVGKVVLTMAVRGQAT